MDVQNESEAEPTAATGRSTTRMNDLNHTVPEIRGESKPKLFELSGGENSEALDPFVRKFQSLH